MVGVRESGEHGRLRSPMGGFWCEYSQIEEYMESVKGSEHQRLGHRGSGHAG